MATTPLETTPHVNSITRQIIAAAMKVHTLLGPGLLESAYNACLVHELRKRGFRVESRLDYLSSMTAKRSTSDIASI
jgi:GxxExxY protein